MSGLPRRCIVVGRGRAGHSFARALEASGWHVDLRAARPLLEPAADLTSLTESLRTTDLVLIAVTDSAIAHVARVLPASDALVAHVSGATGLDVLDGHVRVASIHPLMSLPDGETGARRLLDHCTFAIDGDPSAHDVVASLGGRSVDVRADQRALYHATAAIAANHLAALCAQVERLAETVGVPASAYWTMMGATLDNVTDSGAAAALTGPAARGDWATVRAHLAALPSAERPLYRSLMLEAAAVGGQEVPDDLRFETNDGPTPTTGLVTARLGEGSDRR